MLTAEISICTERAILSGEELPQSLTGVPIDSEFKKLIARNYNFITRTVRYEKMKIRN